MRVHYAQHKILPEIHANKYIESKLLHTLTHRVLASHTKTGTRTRLRRHRKIVRCLQSHSKNVNISIKTNGSTYTTNTNAHTGLVYANTLTHAHTHASYANVRAYVGCTSVRVYLVRFHRTLCHGHGHSRIVSIGCRRCRCRI